MAFRIIFQAFRMIFGNLGRALRITIGPYLIALCLFMVFSAGLDSAGLLEGRTVIDSSGLPQVSGWVFSIPLVFVLLMLCATIWVAVAWHRFVLLGEFVGILPAIKFRLLWSYVSKMILLGSLVALITILTFWIFKQILLFRQPSVSTFGGAPPFVLLIYLFTVLLSFLFVPQYYV